MKLPYTDNDDANLLVEKDPLALLIGLLLDQQIKIEQAFLGPWLLSQRIGGLDAAEIAAMGEEQLIEVFQTKPALHRFPANMAKRTRAMCDYIASEYDNHPEQIWEGAEDGRDLKRRLLAIPGYGEGKVGTLIGILGKRLEVAPPGWEDVAPSHMTLADVDTFDDILTYREYKRAQKAKN